MTPTPIWLLANPQLRQGHSQAFTLAAQHHAHHWSLVLEGGPGDLSLPCTLKSLHLHQLSSQCVCCVGQLPLRVTLARILRMEKPLRIILELAHDEHLSEVQRLLAHGSFSEYLVLEALP